MQQTIIDLHVSLPKADASVAATVTQTVRAAGFFGYRSIDVTAPDSVQLGLLAHVDYSAADAVLSLPLLSAGGIDAGTSSAVTRVRELDAHLTELAERIGYPCYFYEAQTDWELLVDGTGIDHDGQDLAGEDLFDETQDPDAAGEELIADRLAFIIYGEVASPDRVVYELARDTLGPVTLVPGAPSIGFAVDGQEDTPVWLGKRPVLEISQSDLTLVSWYTNGKVRSGASAQGATAQWQTPRASVAERIHNKFAARHIWALTTEPYVPTTHELLQDPSSIVALRPDSAELGGMLDAQETSLRTAYLESALDCSDDFAAAEELALELGLEGEQRTELIRVLTANDRAVALTELVTALGLPSTTEAALTGALDPRSLEGAVTAEKANFRAETGLHNLTERPTGTSFTDKLRQLDHDRPALALVLILVMFAASTGALFLGISRPGVFANLGLTIAAYIIGIIVLADSVTSLISWIMIRKKNRAGRSSR